MAPEVMTKEAADEVIKSIKEATDALKAAKADNKEEIKTMVEETIKAALRNHPGRTEGRTIEFPDGMPSKEQDIMAKMPKDLQLESDGIFLMSKLFGKSPKELKSWENFTRKAGEFKKAL